MCIYIFVQEYSTPTFITTEYFVAFNSEEKRIISNQSCPNQGPMTVPICAFSSKPTYSRPPT